MSSNGARNGKHRDFTEEHAAACVRAKEELAPIADREIVQMIEQQGELYGVAFARPPSRQRVNNWTRDAKVQKAIENGAAITLEMLRGRGTSILWMVLDRAESLIHSKPDQAAECVAVVARAAKHFETRSRQTQPSKPSTTPKEGQEDGDAPSIERMREALSNAEGGVIAAANGDEAALARDAELDESA